MRKPNYNNDMVRDRFVTGLNREEFARILKISVFTVDSIESGRLNYTDKHRLRVAALNKANIQEILEERVCAYRIKLYKIAGIL